MEPSWYSELLASGEALACLSLCGNTAMQMRDDGAGSSVTYTPRGSVSDGGDTRPASPTDPTE